MTWKCSSSSHANAALSRPSSASAMTMKRLSRSSTISGCVPFIPVLRGALHERPRSLEIATARSKPAPVLSTCRASTIQRPSRATASDGSIKRSVSDSSLGQSAIRCHVFPPSCDRMMPTDAWARSAPLSPATSHAPSDSSTGGEVMRKQCDGASFSFIRVGGNHVRPPSLDLVASICGAAGSPTGKAQNNVPSDACANTGSPWFPSVLARTMGPAH